jgi:uncharacterized protein
MVADTVQPFYFGAPDSRLYGCYDPPNGQARDAGVVLCYPVGHEYEACHRAFRQLAARLARRGFAVLRFDYYGSGDSAGDFEEASLARWRWDIEAAVSELRKRSGRSKVRLIGLRLGASLSLQAAAGREDLSGLVLWDPVLDGRRYLEDTMDLMARRGDLGASAREGEVREILGYPFSRTLRLELEALDLSSLPRAIPGPVLILDTRKSSGAESLAQAFRERSENVQYTSLEAPALQLERVDRVTVPLNVIEAIASWMGSDRECRE